MKETWLALGVLALAMGTAGGQTRVDLRTQSRNLDFSGATETTRPFRTGTQLPAACQVGDAFFKTDAPAGQNLYGCTAVNAWTLQSGGGGGTGLPSMTGQEGKVLGTDGTSALWRALGGDLAGAPEAATVIGLQGRRIGSNAPTDGQVLRWNAAGSQWEPYPVASGGAANYAQSFTSQTAVTIAGSAHNMGTANLIVTCYDNATPAQQVEPNTVTVHPATFDVTVTFTAAQSGRCVLNGSGAGFAALTNVSNTFASGTVQTFQGALVATGADRTAPAKAGTALPPACSPGDQFFKTDATAGQNLYFCTGTNSWAQMSGTGGSVLSVFGRTGAVGAQAGDYAFGQIAGTITDSQVGTGISATKIAAGVVGNTAFGYLANATSDIQAQLNGKAAAGHTHTAGGDVAGDFANTTVTRIQNRSVAATAPGDGQALVWSAAANSWQPGAGGGGGGGAGMASQLNDFGIVRTSSTVLTIGGNCSIATPCNVRFGNTVYSFTRSCTATLSAGTGTAYVYVTSGGTLTVGHNMSLTASAGCLAQSSLTTFPADSVPLHTFTASGGAWDVDGGRDMRAFLSLKNLTAGMGIATTESGGRSTVSVDTATVPTYLVGTATINFPSVPSGSCSADLSFTLLGAVLNDSVVPGWPSTLEPGLLGLMRVSASNTIAVRLCNFSGTAVDPAGAAYRAIIVRSF